MDLCKGAYSMKQFNSPLESVWVVCLPWSTPNGLTLFYRFLTFVGARFIWVKVHCGAFEFFWYTSCPMRDIFLSTYIAILWQPPPPQIVGTPYLFQPRYAEFDVFVFWCPHTHTHTRCDLNHIGSFGCCLGAVSFCGNLHFVMSNCGSAWHVDALMRDGDDLRIKAVQSDLMFKRCWHSI